MKGRRPGSKGNEWLLIKKKDECAKPGFDIDKLDWSVLTKRSMKQIAGDEGSREWESHRAAAPSKTAKNAWLADTIAKVERKKAVSTKSKTAAVKKSAKTSSGAAPKKSARNNAKSSQNSEGDRLELASLPGIQRGDMPRVIHPMLATLTDHPFSSDDWLFEIKWDGYRAIAFIRDGEVEFVSRNQNEMTSLYPELHVLPKSVQGKQVILDGEIVALDEKGRPSFSLMQQRAGIRSGVKRSRPDTSIPVLYYVFDLLYIDGWNLMRVDLEKRKDVLKQIIEPSDPVRYSEHFFREGEQLYEAARQQGLEGIVAKRRRSCYEQKRSREWLKLKITQRQECVIGGYTDPRGSREHFGSLILGLYDDKGHLIHVGHAGSGFTGKTHEEMWKRLHMLDTDKSPFFGKVEATRTPHWVRPELVAEIKFNEWTHEGQSGAVKLRAPVFEGLRMDKDPKDCVFEKVVPAEVAS
jgi:bifunctional non-homologous end joining protein LigD